MSIEDALSGNLLNNRDMVKPEDWEKYWGGRGLGKDFSPEKHRADVAAFKISPEDTIRSWMMDHSEFLLGGYLQGAKRAETMTDLLRSGRPNEQTIYRGSRNPLSTEIKFNAPLSFTTDYHVARSFAGRGGIISKLPAGSVRGVFVPDFVNRQRTVGSGRRTEEEFIVDPESLK